MDDVITKKIVFNKQSLPSISCCIIAKDEEENLKRLLPILTESLDEVVVVDTGSNDNTKSVATELGAQVYEFPWNNSFADARNFSISKATKDYILWLDADDMIYKQDLSRLKFHVHQNPGTAVFLILLDKRLDKEFQSIQLRLFPNHKDLKFIGRVHEQISFDVEKKGIKYSYSDVKVLHIGYDSPDNIIEKLKRNAYLLEKEYTDNPDNFLTVLQLAKTYLGMNEIEKSKPYTDIAVQMVIDGKAGVSRENQFLAFLAKITTYGIEGKVDEAIELLQNNLELLVGVKMARTTLGELYFRKGDYKNAYKYLLSIKNGKVDLGLIPVDSRNISKTLVVFFMFSALAVGDFDSAETVIRGMIRSNDYKIFRGDK